MIEREVFSTELNYLNPISYEVPYKPGIFSQCYRNLHTNIRRVIAKHTDEVFKINNHFFGRLPPLSQAKNDRERDLIYRWLNLRDLIIKNNIYYICPDKVPENIPLPPDLIQNIGDPIPTLTMRDMYDFEALGGVTLYNHGFFISLNTLTGKLDKQLSEIRNKFGSKNITEEYKKKLTLQRVTTGLEWNSKKGQLTATTWLDDYLMLKTINKGVRDNWNDLLKYKTKYKQFGILVEGMPEPIGQGALCSFWILSISTYGMINYSTPILR